MRQKLEANQDRIIQERLNYKSIHDTKAWIVDLNTIQLQKKIYYLQNTPKNMIGEQLQAWSEMVMACEEEFKSQGRIEEAEKCRLVFQQHSPAMYVDYLQIHGKYDDRRQFCKDSVDFYNVYVTDYLEPDQEKLRNAKT